MSNIEVQIKPSGVSKRNLVDCLYAVVSSIEGILTKLDADAGVPEGGGSGTPEYLSLCFTAIFNGSITNSRNETVMNALSGKEDTFFTISPTGIDNRAIVNCFYQIFVMMETMTEKLDADTLTLSTYEANAYTAYYLWRVYDEYGNSVGADTTHTITPMGVNSGWLPDILYAFVKSIHVLTDQLDDDGTVTDTNYEALWDTANILMQVEDSKGNVAGNALTKFDP
jgi:hypothetical protein